jgi:transposase
MTRRSPYVIELTVDDRAVLEARTRAYTAPYHVVVRAKIVLLAADGVENVAIADRLEVSVATVGLWRKRFFQQGLAGLAERKRPGRPRRFSPSGLVRAEAVALACELPTRS